MNNSLKRQTKRLPLERKLSLTINQNGLKTWLLS